MITVSEPSRPMLRLCYCSPDRPVWRSRVNVEFLYGTWPPCWPWPRAPITSASADSDLLMLIVSFNRSLFSPAPEVVSLSLPAKSTAEYEHYTRLHHMRRTQVQHGLALLLSQRVETLDFESEDGVGSRRPLVHQRRCYCTPTASSVQ